jgi:hypothetical protein
MNPERSKHALLAVLLVVLAILVYRGFWRTERPVPGVALDRSGQPAAGGTADLSPGLQIDRLETARSTEPVISRNLFRFGERAPSGTAPPVSVPAAGPAPTSAADAGPPTGDRIAFTLIGIVETPGESARVAVLSDGRGVYHGAAGDIIEGQFRIVSVGTESVEMSRLDDQARQVIRLQGSTNARVPAIQ